MAPFQRFTLDEFQDAMKAQKVSKEFITFICPVCESPQCAHDLIRVGAGNSIEEIEGYLGFSCFGRWTKAKPFKKGKSIPGTGCDWTLGGLFKIHEVEVVSPGGSVRPCFRLATPEQAQEHRKKVLRDLPCGHGWIGGIGCSICGSTVEGPENSCEHGEHFDHCSRCSPDLETS